MTLRTFVARATSGARNLAIAAAFVAFGAVGATAQNTGTVTGLVRDAVSLAPLAGAQVSIEGTQIGGLVNNVGRFLLLNVPAGTHTVNVVLIGYSAGSQSVTVTAGGTATVDFGLREQALSLEGVVVTGTAGQARRREVGNVIESVTSRDIEVGAITSASDVLQGRAAGVQINTTDGQVGSGSNLRIRGNSSATQSNNPLIYVDGVRMENGSINNSDEIGTRMSALDAINPADIDRIEIVKGPAATTLYGTEAAGGVIQIFTKRGSAGAPAWSLSMDGGLSRMGHQGPSDASDLRSVRNQFTADSLPTGDFDVDYLLDGPINQNGFRLNDCATGDPDRGYGPEPGCPASGSWFRDAYMHRYNLSVRGGGETATYFVSGRFASEQGVVDPQGQDSYNVRANIQFQPFDGMDIGLNNMYTRRNVVWIPNGNNASGLFLNVMRGDLGYTPGNDDSLVLDNDLDSRVDSWVTSASIGWSPSASFSHRMNFGMDYVYSDYTDFKPYGNYEQALGSRQNDVVSSRNLTFDYNGSWRTDVTDNISSAFSWGGQLYEENEWGLEGTDAQFAGPGEQLVGGGTLPDTDEDREIIRSGGFFLQEVLGISDRLFITGGIRWDGFSTFGSGFGLAAYPKISAAYTISEESFFPQIDAIDALKLRGAWGKSGRAPAAFDAVKIYVGTQADEAIPGLIISNLGNPDLGPEISQELEAGLELSMFDSRLTADFTWYDQTTLDALIEVQEAPSFGTEQATWYNLGETTNSGIELVMSAVPVRTDNLEWAVNASYSTNDSEIVSLGPLQNLGFSLRVGQPIRVEYDEVVLNVNEGPGNLPEFGLRPTGVLWPTDLIGLGTRLTLNQSLTLDVLAEGQYGHHKPIGVGWAQARRNVWPACYGLQDAWNAADAALEAGGNTNPTNAEIAQESGLQPQQIGACIGNFVRWGTWTDRSDFMRLRSATLSYRLPEGLVPGARTMTVMLQAKNLFTWSSYQGIDPEASDGGLGGGFGGNTPPEYYNLGPPRVFIFNVTVNF